MLNDLAKQKAAGEDTTAADIAKTLQGLEYRGRELDKVDQEKEKERKTRYAELEESRGDRTTNHDRK